MQEQKHGQLISSILSHINCSLARYIW